jgi:predicted small metal-binding protein
MPSYACRNAGLDCDWFVRDSDLPKVLLMMVEHGEKEHKKEFNEGLKEVGFAGVLRFWVSTMKMDE